MITYLGSEQTEPLNTPFEREYLLTLCMPDRTPVSYISYIYDSLEYKRTFLEHTQMRFTIGRETTPELWGKILTDYLVLLETKELGVVVEQEYFVCETPELTTSEQDTMSITCYSYEKSSLNNNMLSGFASGDDAVAYALYAPGVYDPNGIPRGILNYIFEHKLQNIWTIAHIDESLLRKEEVLSYSNVTLKQALDDISERFICAFEFDNINMTVSVHERDERFMGRNNGLVISADNCASKMRYTEMSEGLYTRVSVFGKGNATIARYNPTGQLYVDDFSFYRNNKYMDSALLEALDYYDALKATVYPLWQQYLNRLDAGDESVLPLIQELWRIQDWSNNFTPKQIETLMLFVNEESVNLSLISDERQLYEYAVRHLKTVSFIPVSVEVDSVDVFALPDWADVWHKIKVGDFVNIYRAEFDLYYREMRLISYTHNPGNHSLRFEFSNKDESVTRAWRDMLFYRSLIDMYNNIGDVIINNIDESVIINEVAGAVENIIQGDTFYNYLENVTKVEILAADTVRASTAFIDELVVEHLQTNLLSYICKPKLVFSGEKSKEGVPICEWEGGSHTFYCGSGSDRRNYIDIRGITQEFREAHLTPIGDTNNIALADVEPLIIDGLHFYYSGILGNEDAYKYFSFVPPKDRYTDITPKNAEMFTVYIRKTDAEYVKGAFSFVEVTMTDGNKTLVPALTMGTGDENGRGKLKIYKGVDIAEVVYSSRTKSADIGFKFNDSGIEFYDSKSGEMTKLEDAPRDGKTYGRKDGEWIIGGTGGSGNGNIYTIDHEPTREEIESFPIKDDPEGFMIAVYDPNDPTARWGQTPYEVAKQLNPELKETAEQYNEVLSQIGNLREVLINILGVK